MEYRFHLRLNRHWHLLALQTLGRWEDASWRPIHEAGSQIVPSQPHHSSEENNTPTDGAKTPEITYTPHSTSMELKVGIETILKDSNRSTDASVNYDSSKLVNESSLTMKLTPDGSYSFATDVGGSGANENGLSPSSSLLRCPVVKECTVQVDLRWPYQLVSMHDVKNGKSA